MICHFVVVKRAFHVMPNKGLAFLRVVDFKQFFQYLFLEIYYGFNVVLQQGLRANT